MLGDIMEPLPAKKGRYRPPVEEEGSDYDEGGLGAGLATGGVSRGKTSGR